MSENLLQEFSNFEAKYSIQDEGKPNINFDYIDKENFDLVTFISDNFLLNRENSLINYAKLQEAFQFIHELQGKTLEEIAISVDLNLEKYMDVSNQFEDIKTPLVNINETFIQLKALLNDYKENCQHSSKELNELIGNKEILEVYEEEYVRLKEIRKELLIIQDFLKNPSNFSLIYVSRLFQNIKESLEILIKRGSGGKIKTMIEKFQIKELLQQYKQEFLNLLEAKMKEILKKMINSEITTEKTDDLIRLLNSFEILQETTKAENLVQEVLIKPVLEGLLNSILNSKSGVITATKKEFLEKNLNNKLVLFRQFLDDVKTFIIGNYAIFISLQDSQIKNNLIYYGANYNFVDVLWSSVMKCLGSKEISFIYSVGIADAFYQNYLLAEELMEEFLSIYKGNKSKQFNNELEAFKSKWNLSTYFYLRNNEILKSCEKNFKSTIIAILDKIDKGLSSVLKGNFPLLTCLSEMIKTCFKKGIFLKPLSSNFLRLSFQIMNRFCNLIESYSKTVTIDDNMINQEKICFLSNEIIKIIEFFTLGEFNFQSILSPELNKSLINSFENKLNETLKTILAPIIEKYSKSSFENLEVFIKYNFIRNFENFSLYKPFNGIPAKFRMNLSAINVQKPSNFIGNVFKPLQNFLLMNLLIDETQNIVKKEVLDRVFKNFQSLIQDILKSSQKSEELMAKFINQEKNKESELEKIKLQFKLDFIEMKRISETKFGYKSSCFIAELD